MPQASKRAQEMPASPIRRLVPLAVAAEKRGVHVHYLNIGQPDIISPDSFWQGIEAARVPTVAYSPSPGIPELRHVAVEDFQRRGLPVQPEDLVVTAGGSEATLFAFLACFDPGDEVIVVEPFYANYQGFAVEAGVTLVPLTTYLDDDFALPDIAAVKAKLTPRTKGILICNPSNPTGTSFTTAQLEALAELAIERDLFLIVDEVYRDFNYTDTPLTSVLNLPGLGHRAVMLDSVSKRFSLCGARVGFFVAKHPEVAAAANRFAQARLAVSTLEQHGVAAAIKNTPPEYFQKVRTEYMARRDCLLEELAQIPGVKAPRVNGAFYAVVRLPVSDADAFCQWMLSDFSHHGQTTMMAPANGFYFTPGLGEDEVRIAYVLEKEKLREACQVLAHGLTAYHHLKSREATHA
jgi:aspartate aminotransferase